MLLSKEAGIVPKLVPVKGLGLNFDSRLRRDHHDYWFGSTGSLNNQHQAKLPRKASVGEEDRLLEICYAVNNHLLRPYESYRRSQYCKVWAVIELQCFSILYPDTEWHICDEMASSNSLMSYPSLHFALGLAILSCVYGLYRLIRIGSRDPRLPPGPPTIPILGNLHQVPITGIHKKYVHLWPRFFPGLRIYSWQSLDSKSGENSMAEFSPSNLAQVQWLSFLTARRFISYWTREDLFIPSDHTTT